MARASSALLKRRLDIADIVRKRGEVKVDELAELLGVSGVTIRQDLTYLEQQGYLKRSFGGAIYLVSEGSPVGSKPPLPSYNQTHYSRDELELVQQSLAYIQEGDTLWLSHGNLLRKLIPFLYEKKSLTLIVNDLATAQLAKEFTSAEVIVVGGILTDSNVVQDTHMMSFLLSQYTISCVIIEAAGINFDNELVIHDADQLGCYRQLIKHAEHAIAILPLATAPHDGSAIAKLKDIDLAIFARPAVTEYHQQLLECSFTQITANKQSVTYQNRREE